MTSTKLTAKQTALLVAIAERKFSFFDDGLVEDSGIWMNCLTGECGPEIAANPRGAATVASSLVKKGYLTSTGDEDNEDGAWVALTAKGAAWCVAYNEADAEDAPAAEEAPVIQEELPLPEEAPAAPVTPKKARKTKKAAKEDPAPAAPATPVISEDEDGVTYTVEEESLDTADYGTEEWIRVRFADGSYTERRRRKVSGAWRTDFWGIDAAGKRFFILSRDAKAAKEQGFYVGPAPVTK